MGGAGPGWRLIQDHRHSIVWGARPPKWSLFPPITPPPAHVSTVMCKVVLDRRIFLTDWRGDQSVKKKNCQKYVCIFLCLVVFEEERDTLNRKTIRDSHSMDSWGSKYSQNSFRQPFYGFFGAPSILKTVLDSHSMDSWGSESSQDSFRQPFYGFMGLQVFSRQF